MRISKLSMAALALAMSLVAGSAMAAATPPATAPAVKTGSISGMVVDKDGKPAVGMTVRAVTEEVAAAGGRGGGRGARGARGAGAAPIVTDAKGAFTLKDVPVGKMAVIASTPFAGRGGAPAAPTSAPAATPQRGVSEVVEVKEGAETKLTKEIKLADAPAGGGRRGGGGGAPPAAPN